MSKYTRNHNAAFCRTLLSETMREVRKHFTREQIAKAWAWTGDGKDFEFHGPNGEYLYNLRMTDCLTSAKAEGWSQILAALEPDVCIAGAPAVKGICGDPDCVCAPKNVVSNGSLETPLETSAGVWQLDTAAAEPAAENPNDESSRRDWLASGGRP